MKAPLFPQLRRYTLRANASTERLNEQKLLTEYKQRVCARARPTLAVLFFALPRARESEEFFRAFFRRARDDDDAASARIGRVLSSVVVFESDGSSDRCMCVRECVYLIFSTVAVAVEYCFRDDTRIYVCVFHCGVCSFSEIEYAFFFC